MSPLTTKLRLLFERAERAFRISRADKERAWLVYMEQMRAEGFCPNCEKPLQECKCVAMATGGYDIEPSAPYLVGQHTHVCVVPASIAEKIRGKLCPEIEGQSSEAITSTETSGLPARQMTFSEAIKILRHGVDGMGNEGPEYDEIADMLETQLCLIPRSIAEEIQKEQCKWDALHGNGLPFSNLKVPMPPVKPPRT